MNRLLRRQEVELRTGLGTSTIYRRMSPGHVPAAARPAGLRSLARSRRRGMDRRAWREGGSVTFRPYKVEQHEHFLRLRADGLTRAQIAAVLGLRPASIKSRLEYLRARGVL